MSSKIQICNRALSRLAASRITSFDDNTVESKLCSIIYDEVAEEVMSKGPWPSCLKRTALAQLTDTPTFGYAYAYQLPNDPKCLKVLSINECSPGSVNYKIEDGKLLIDEASVSVLYMAYITDPESYDVYLRQAIIENLVAEMAYQLTGQAKIADISYQKAEAKTRELLSQSNSQGSNETLPSDLFINVRI